MIKLNKVTKILAFSAYLSTSLLLTSCGKEETRTKQLDQVVWSDDGTEQAYVVMRFTEKRSLNPLNGTTEKKNFTHQVFIGKSDGTNHRAVGNEFTGQNGASLYYMKNAGYIVASTLEANGDGAGFERFYKLDMNGTTYRLTQEPNEVAVPSPDGKYISRVRFHPEQCNTLPDTPHGSNCTVDLQFLDAQTLQIVDDKTSHLNFGTDSAVPDVTWTNAGEFIVSTGNKAFSITPSTTAKDASKPECFNPKTSSSNINAAGQFVFVSGNQILSQPATEPGFGCQYPTPAS